MIAVKFELLIFQSFFLFVHIHSTIEKKTNFMQAFSEVYHKKRLRDYHSNSTEASLFECMILCMNTENCISANYNSMTGDCEKSCGHVAYDVANTEVDSHYSNAYIISDKMYSFPYKAAIIGGMTPGKSVHIYGNIARPSSDIPAKSFEINLVTSDGRDYPLIVIIEVNNWTITVKRRSFVNGTPSTPVHDSNFRPVLTINEPFHLEIKSFAQKYKLYKDGKEFAAFDHIFKDLSSVTQLEVGDLQTEQIATLKEICIA